MTSESARQLVDGLEAAWRELRAATERLGAGALEEVTPSGWTAKEMLSHVAFWDEAVVANVPMAFRGQPLPPGWRFASGYAPGESWPAAGATVLATLTDDEARERADYFRRLVDHYVEHRGELGALLSGGGGPEPPR